MLLKDRMEVITKSLLREVVSLNENKRRAQSKSFSKQMAGIINEISNSAGISAEDNPGGKNAYEAVKSFDAAVDAIEIKTAADILADYIAQTNN